MIEQVEALLAEQRQQAVAELCDFLRIPSVSADSKFRADVRRAAEFTRAAMERAGLTVEVVETAGHPIVYGEFLGAPGKPTVIVYGHYDVQPADPLDQWISPAFEPTVRDGKLFARGATDDKGQVFTHIKSLEAWTRAAGRPPVNVKFIVEGEEEVGSKNLDLFLEGRREALRGDVAVISDSSQFAPGQPAICHGLRGILACEVKLIGPKQDLHSGIFGGSIANPVNALCAIIGELIDARGRVQIPGFYDAVRPLTPAERERIAALPFDEAAYLKSLGMPAVFGEEGYSTLERRWCRPTCDVNGVTGGYQGEGPKTIVPASATAKITCRLVPDQDPDRLTAALRSFFEARLRPGLKLEFAAHHGCPGLVFDTGSAWMQAAARAIEAAFGKAPVFVREGGSIPVVNSLKQVLGVETLLLGWGQNTDNLHSPNEHFTLADFHNGTRASARLWHELANRA